MAKNQTNAVLKDEGTTGQSEQQSDVKTNTTEPQTQSEPPVNIAQTEAPKQQLTEAQTAIVNGSTTKSFKIRALLASGLTRGAVAKALGIRYQHVRNVEITPIKKTA